MKNTMMRIASILMVVALLTACVISGTFAKYVTEASAEDTARVAKWGIVIEKAGEGLFLTEYETTDTATYTEEYSVESSDEKNLVAPGTESDASNSVTITGTPEVATKVEVVISGFKTVYLPAQEAVAATETTPAVEARDEYYPIVFTFAGEDFKTLDELATAIGNNAVVDGDKITITYIIDPNKNVEDTVPTLSIAWKWAFEQDKDVEDTLLGNIAAGKATVEGAVTDVAYTVTVTATQID